MLYWYIVQMGRQMWAQLQPTWCGVDVFRACQGGCVRLGYEGHFRQGHLLAPVGPDAAHRQGGVSAPVLGRGSRLPLRSAWQGPAGVSSQDLDLHPAAP